MFCWIRKVWDIQWIGFKIQSKNYKIGTYKINKISLPCFDDKIYIQNNGSISSWLLELIIKKQLS